MNYPVIIFCYKRLDCLKLTIEKLAANFLAADTELFVFSDGPKGPLDTEAVDQVRSFVKTVTGFKQVNLVESAVNKGLAKSIIGGVTQVLERYEAAIVLEDDLLTSNNFLNFMNESLRYYRDNKKVFSIAGYSSPVEVPQGYKSDVYFTLRGSSWGWATWKDRWETVDWEIRDYEEFSRNIAARKKFNRMGSDMTHMLAKQMQGKINSWAIRWCYNQFKKDMYTVFPVLSKVENVGFGEAATNTSSVQNSRFATKLDVSGKVDFRFEDKVELNPVFTKQFVRPYSIATRLKYKFLGLLAS